MNSIQQPNRRCIVYIRACSTILWSGLEHMTIFDGQLGFFEGGDAALQVPSRVETSKE